MMNIVKMTDPSSIIFSLRFSLSKMMRFYRIHSATIIPVTLYNSKMIGTINLLI